MPLLQIVEQHEIRQIQMQKRAIASLEPEMLQVNSRCLSS